MKKYFLLLISLIYLLNSCNSDEKDNINQFVNTQDEEILLCSFDLVNKPENTPSKPNAAILDWPRWQTGQTIKVKFFDGNETQHEKVKTYISQWTNYANLKIAYVPADEYADIRIAFEAGTRKGAWSELGMQSAYGIGNWQNEPSIRLGPLTASNESSISRTVLHEFGHALGLVHETTNPAANIKWDLPKVYAWYSSNNGWTKEEVNTYVINKSSDSSNDYSEYDPLSIMHYYIPASITTDGVAVYEQSWLSKIDMESISKWYPYPIKSIIEKGQRIDLIPFTRSIKSQNELYILNFKNGILSIRETMSQQTIWEAGTYYGNGSSAALENGNLMIRKNHNGLKTIIWTSSRFLYNGSCNLELQNDGNLVLFHDGIPKWSSKAGEI